MVWEPVLDLIEEAVDENGYFYSPISFKKFAVEHGLDAKQPTPHYVSIDFWSGQHQLLRGRGWYVIRLGQGRFAIFSEKIFPKPYTELSTKNAENLELDEFVSLPHFNDAFSLMMRESSAENSILELLRFGGVYDAFIEKFSKSKRYIVGPRGRIWPRFNLYMKKRSQELVSFKSYGQTELDYSLWAEDRIFIIEAKSEPVNGLDVGWHKMAYPTQYYSTIACKHGIEIVPVYLLRNYSEVENTVYMFVFPPYEPYKGDGLILNDQSVIIPERVVRVDLNALLPLPQKTLQSFSGI